jgi:hypothetical protein
MEPVAAVCAILKIDVRELPKLPLELITRACREARLEIAQEAAVLLQAQQPREDAIKTLVSHQERVEERAAEPWRFVAESERRFRDSIKARTPQQLYSDQKAIFVALLKQRRLAPDEVMTASYGLYGTPDTVAFFTECLLTKAPHERVRAHNFCVATALGDSFVSTYGHLLEHLPLPLGPPVEECQAFNISLMRDFGAFLANGPHAPHGGGADTLRARQFRSNLFADDPPPPAGAGHLPVTQSGEGLVVDVSAIEAAFTHVFNTITVLQAEVQKLATGGAASNAAATTEIKKLVETVRKQVAESQRVAKSGGRAGGGRGRGLGGTGYGRGGQRVGARGWHGARGDAEGENF